jgi:hypothetical protein
MAKRQRRYRKSGRTTLLWWGLYAVAGYYGYRWYTQYRYDEMQKTLTQVPQGTQQ